MVLIGSYIMEKDAKPVKRSVSLSQKTNSDLLTLTNALGVNAHSYMVNEIAKAVQRDSLALQINKNTQEQISTLFDSLASVIQDKEAD